MSKKIIHAIDHFPTIETSLGELPIIHLDQNDIFQLASFLHDHDSDTRGFELTAHEEYSTLGKNKLRALWRQTNLSLAEFSDEIPADIIRLQSDGIIGSAHIREKRNVRIEDPFCMGQIEKEFGIGQLRQIQLQNTLVVKDSDSIVACVRLLDVEGEVEMVDLAVAKLYRKNGIASRLIQEALSNSTRRPIYSFMIADPKLIHFYCQHYASEGGFVPLFNQLPEPLQRDLAHMNQFWGPNIIMGVPGKK